MAEPGPKSWSLTSVDYVLYCHGDVRKHGSLDDELWLRPHEMPFRTKEAHCYNSPHFSQERLNVRQLTPPLPG